MDYHLSIAGERSGPHTQFYIIQGIRDGRFKGDELAWHQGLSEWQPLKDITEFQGFWPLTEEDLAQAEIAKKLARSELDRPRPWLRFWARTLDRFWFLFAFGLVVNLVAPDLPQWLLDNPVLRIFFGALVLLLYVPAEAWLLSRFGCTPGRALLRMQVRRLDGGLPHFDQALRRSFQVYVKGLAMGLPFLDIIAMLLARMALLQRGATPWDEANETRVEHGEPEPWRYLVLAGVVVGVAVTMAIVAALAGELSHLPR